MIRNLTMHPVILVRDECPDRPDDISPYVRETIAPDGVVAHLEEVDGGNVVTYGAAGSIPAPQPGVQLVVPLATALALCGQRDDLLVPYQQIRTTAGSVAGARRLVQPRVS